MTIKWDEEVSKRKDSLIEDTQKYLRIKSVLDEESATQGAPFGKGINEALNCILTIAEEDGFTTKNLDGYAAHIEYGEGEELIGILCHVDVVPEGDGWSSDPYAAEIRDDKIYARGAMDDKGPTMAAYYGLKIVKELGLPINKRVRLILGTDEESEWRGVTHYFQHKEMPTMGFAPDADFPVINAEKGIYDVEFLQKKLATTDESTVAYRLVSFSAGRRLNMVPDLAEAEVELVEGSVETLEKCLKIFLQEESLTGTITTEGTRVTINVEGVSAHGSTPDNGKNAGLYLLDFLNGFDFDTQAASFIQFCVHNFVGDSSGEKLGIASEDEVSGPLTLNVGTFSYTNDGGKIGCNIRYPVTLEPETLINGIKAAAAKNDYDVAQKDHKHSLFVNEDHALIQTLTKVYEEQMGEKATLLSIGGGTYARSLDAGVAFGMQFPGRPDLAHQKDECIAIGDLLKGTAIYAQAIYELAK